MDLQALVVQQPTQAAQLVLLFHGEFTTAHAMLPLASALATTFPQALVACIEAPYATPDGDARTWLAGAYSDDALNKLAPHVQSSMPSFLQMVGYWQSQTGVTSQATALVGFGQGATLVLESTQTDTPPASRVVAIAGRFATLPNTSAYRGTIHLLHGKSDTTVPFQHAIATAYRLRDLGIDLTAEVLPFIGHELHLEFINATVNKLSNHISKHLLEEHGNAESPAPPIP